MLIREYQTTATFVRNEKQADKSWRKQVQVAKLDLTLDLTLPVDTLMAQSGCQDYWQTAPLHERTQIIEYIQQKSIQKAIETLTNASTQIDMITRQTNHLLKFDFPIAAERRKAIETSFNALMDAMNRS